MNKTNHARFDQYHLLIIDDVISDVAYLVALLKKRGDLVFEHRHIITFDDLEKALDERQWDLVLCDFLMPMLDASRAIQLSLSMQPTTPIILLSDIANVEDAVDMMRLGARAFIEKGDHERLIKIVKQELETTRALRKSAQIEAEFRQTTAKLQGQRDQLSQILHQSRDFVALGNLEGTIEFINWGGAVMLDAEHPDVIIGKRATDFHLPEDVEALIHNYLPYALEKGYWRGRNRLKSLKGRILDVDQTLFPIVNEKGEVVQVATIMVDITEQKLMEEKLIENYRQLDNFFDVSQDLLCITDKDGRFIKVSKAWESVLGYTIDAMEGRLLFDFIHPDDIPLTLEQRHKLKNQENVVDFVNRYRAKDGTYHFIEWRSNPHGDVFYGAARDITERIKSEQALKTSQVNFQMLFEKNPHPMWVYDLKTLAFLEVNASAIEHYGYSRDEFLAMTLLDIRPSEDFERLKASVSDERTPLQRSGEWHHRLKDGRIIDVKITSHTLEFREHQGALVVAQDITEVKQAQKALQEAYDLLEQRVLERTAELEREKHRIEAIINHSSEGILLLHVDEGIQMANYAFEKMFGIASDEIHGGLIEWIHPDDAPMLEIIFQQAVEQHEAQHVESRARRKDGSIFDVEISIAPVNRSQKIVKNLVCILWDITGRKQAQEALDLKHQEEMKMQSYLKGLHEITLRLTRAETLDDFYRGVIEESLARFDFERIGLFLYEEGGAVGTYGTGVAGELTQEYDLHLTLEELGDIFEITLDRQTRFAFEENGKLMHRLEFLTMGQHAVAALWNHEALGWLSIDNAVHHKPITKTQLSILALYALTTGSLLARKRAEFALRQNEEKWRLYIESSPIATLVVQQDGVISTINKQAEITFGYERSELMGLMIEVLVPDGVRSHHVDYRATYAKHPETRRMHTMELSAQRKDGSIFPADIQLSYVTTPDGIVIMIYVIDITQRKQAEKVLYQALAHERELNELKSRFVSIASHEFRTPLSGILATTDTLIHYRERMDEDRIDGRLKKIRQQVNFMQKIMEDVLQLARIQSGRVEFKPMDAYLDALCREIIEEFESMEIYRDRLRYEGDKSVRLLFDEHLIRQALTNLISNALKYSAQKSPVYITLEENTTQIILKVSDDGIGIPASDLKYLFEPFHRARNVANISGTGLGLSIVKQAIELHGGTIHVDSQIERGTTVTINIPLTTSRSEEYREDTRD